MDADKPVVIAIDVNFHLLEQITGYVAAAIMVLGGMLPYVPQYMAIKRTDNQEGFSLYVCLVLIIANTLRIIFWFGHSFEIPLLLQSVVMTITMFGMVHCCITCRNKTQVLPRKDRIFTDFDYRYFWEWSDFLSYVEFELMFATAGCLLMYVFLDKSLFVEIVGFAALLLEAMLALPQFYRNFKANSTNGMSRQMVWMWLMGDTFKTVYFYVRRAPVQFLVCGFLQIILDLAVIAQSIIYTSKKKFFSN